MTSFAILCIGFILGQVATMFTLYGWHWIKTRNDFTQQPDGSESENPDKRYSYARPEPPRGGLPNG